MTNEQARRIDRIINDLVTSINTDVSPIIQPTRPEGGYFGVPRMVFCYIDFLGLLFSGWSGKKKKNGDKDDFATPQKAKTYIKKVLSQVDENYMEKMVTCFTTCIGTVRCISIVQRKWLPEHHPIKQSNG